MSLIARAALLAVGSATTYAGVRILNNATKVRVNGKELDDNARVAVGTIMSSIGVSAAIKAIFG
jgi:hypothetical protein